MGRNLEPWNFYIEHNDKINTCILKYIQEIFDRGCTTFTLSDKKEKLGQFACKVTFDGNRRKQTKKISFILYEGSGRGTGQTFISMFHYTSSRRGSSVSKQDQRSYNLGITWADIYEKYDMTYGWSIPEDEEDEEEEEEEKEDDDDEGELTVYMTEVGGVEYYVDDEGNVYDTDYELVGHSYDDEKKTFVREE